MSRSTQYIGLNEYAIRWLATQKVITSGLKVITTGMFDELVNGTFFDLTPPEGPNKRYIVEEVVQDIVWSSGPMIFTYLKATLEKECGQLLPMGDWFKWMLDPSVTNEVDYSTGRYYV